MPEIKTISSSTTNATKTMTEKKSFFFFFYCAHEIVHKCIVRHKVLNPHAYDSIWNRPTDYYLCVTNLVRHTRIPSHMQNKNILNLNACVCEKGIVFHSVQFYLIPLFFFEARGNPCCKYIIHVFQFLHDNKLFEIMPVVCVAALSDFPPQYHLARIPVEKSWNLLQFLIHDHISHHIACAIKWNILATAFMGWFNRGCYLVIEFATPLKQLVDITNRFHDISFCAFFIFIVHLSVFSQQHNVMTRNSFPGEEKCSNFFLE